MAENRIVSERNLREQKIQEALANKPTTPFLNKHGMTPKQIYQNFSRQIKKNPLTGQFVKVDKSTQSTNVKPLRITRNNPKIPITQFDKYIEIEPITDFSDSTEFPTPEEFRINEKVDVSVIIPLYKSNIVIIDLINSWTFEHKGLTVEAIFVDDCCPNNSKATVLNTWIKLNNKKPIGKIIQNTVNKGYGASCNIGAEFASGDYLIFLNADTKLTPNWIEPMIRVMKNDPSVGVVGNLQIKEGGEWHETIDSAGSEWSWDVLCFLHIGRHSYQGRHLPRPFDAKTAPHDILTLNEREMVTGCCFAVPKNLWSDLGGFNPNYKIGYWEDSELCMSVKEKGLKVMFQPESKIFHKLSHTNSGSHPHHDYNRNYFINKWVSSGRIDDLVKNKRTTPILTSILLKRKGANGDVLMAAAVAPALKAKYPNVKISFATECGEVLENNPYIDQVVPASFNRNFQVFYNLDMAYELRPNTHILTAYAEAVGVKPTDCFPYLNTTPVEIPQNYIVIHPGKTAWVGRDWKHDNFRELAELLLKDGKNIVCIGKHSEESVPCSLDLRGQLNIAQLAYVVKNAAMFIGIDSFPMHVAQTFDTPGICFFGSINPKLRLIKNSIKPVTAFNLPCLGCHHRKPAPRVITNVCETNTLDCVNLVKVNQVYQMVKEYYGKFH